MSSTSILALDQLPYETVYKLACAANSLASRHIRCVRRRIFLIKRAGLMGCDVCHRTAVTPTEKLEHADWCPVGRTQQAALEIIKLGSQPLPKHAKALQMGATPQQAAEAEVHLAHLESRKFELSELAPGLRITEVPPTHERSDERSERRRTNGNSTGAVLASPPSYEEPWAWDPQQHTVVDRHNLVVADLLAKTDLTAEAQEQVGKRIVACVNFLAGSFTNEWLRDAEQKIARTMGEREEILGVVLDLDADGWFVRHDGSRLDFPSHDDAKAYFDARVYMAREAARVRA